MQLDLESRVSTDQRLIMHEAAIDTDHPVTNGVQPSLMSIHAENFLRGVSEFEEYQMSSRSDNIEAAKQDIGAGEHQP